MLQKLDISTKLYKLYCFSKYLSTGRVKFWKLQNFVSLCQSEGEFCFSTHGNGGGVNF